jgi:hypothetical protein
LKNWIQVARLNDVSAPIRTATAYKWHHLGRFPELFHRVGGKLFLDIDEFYRMAKDGKLR